MKFVATTEAAHIIEREPAAVLRNFERRYIPEPNSGCWLWIGDADERGYGRFSLFGKPIKAHRLSVILSGRDIPEGMVIDHLCRVHCCVNPAHLDVVTNQTNARRGETGARTAALKRAVTHCPSGHAYDAHNTYVNSQGHRRCRRCRADGMRRGR